MEKHKLDEQVEDVLQHYGIKGMKWGIERSDEQIAAASEASGGGGEVDEEYLLDDLGDAVDDIVDALDKTIDNISDAIKAKGASLITSLFGKGKPKYKIAKPDKELSKNLGELMRRSKLSDSQQKALKKAEKDEKTRSKRAVNSSPGVDAAIDKLKKKGYKKVEPKDKRSLKEKGYKLKAYSKKDADSVINNLKKKGYKKVD